MTNPKPATVGEREVCKFTGLWLANVRRNKASSKLARRIDAVVNKAFKDGEKYGPYSAGKYTGDRAVYLKICAKYGVKGSGK